MGTSNELNEVLSKLAKIRELASRGGTLAEAEAASAKMNTLLLRYNLSLSDVERHANETLRTVEKEDIRIDGSLWKAQIMWGIADAHLCKAFRVASYRYSRNTRMEVFGHAHNLIVVKETYYWLIEEINRLADVAHAEALRGWDWRAEESPRSWKNSFRVGAAHGVSAAYRTARKTVRAEAGEQWALVPLLEAEVQHAIDIAYAGQRLTNTRVGPGSNADAYSAGRTAGLAISTERQVGERRHAALS